MMCWAFSSSRCDTSTCRVATSSSSARRPFSSSRTQYRLRMSSRSASNDVSNCISFISLRRTFNSSSLEAKSALILDSASVCSCSVSSRTLFFVLSSSALASCAWHSSSRSSRSQSLYDCRLDKSVLSLLASLIPSSAVLSSSARASCCNIISSISCSCKVTISSLSLATSSNAFVIRFNSSVASLASAFKSCRSLAILSWAESFDCTTASRSFLSASRCIVMNFSSSRAARRSCRS
mmetsp:Transcript_7408/g.14766  ORF Transcript_7408/g.14766 Transcript_7408/m.14766 type:complete len:237 (+) Transcript_7408:311-1021(+)